VTGALARWRWANAAPSPEHITMHRHLLPLALAALSAPAAASDCIEFPMQVVSSAGSPDNGQCHYDVTEAEMGVVIYGGALYECTDPMVIEWHVDYLYGDLEDFSAESSTQSTWLGAENSIATGYADACPVVSIIYVCLEQCDPGDVPSTNLAALVPEPEPEPEPEPICEWVTVDVVTVSSYADVDGDGYGGELLSWYTQEHQEDGCGGERVLDPDEVHVTDYAAALVQPLIDAGAPITEIQAYILEVSVGDDGDCDDGDDGVYPGADEVCDGADQDCDGDVDEGVESAFYPDGDQDGLGAAGAAAEMACQAPAGTVSNDDDCDDSDDQKGPLYNAAQDSDGYGYGDCDTWGPQCVAPGQAGFAWNCDDCDDADPEVGPKYWAQDADGDGYGDPTTFEMICDPEDEGMVENLLDCDDGDSSADGEATRDARQMAGRGCEVDAISLVDLAAVGVAEPQRAALDAREAGCVSEAFTWGGVPLFALDGLLLDALQESGW